MKLFSNLYIILRLWYYFFGIKEGVYMIIKRILISLLLVCFMQIQTFALADLDVIETHSNEIKNYSATTSNNAVNKEALEEAQKAYSAAGAADEIDIVPLFQNWTKREAQRKINNIGNKILIANNLDNFARFAVSGKESVNASANFHGVVEVYKGLLEYVETDDELAYVLGHEIAHITKDDSKNNIIRGVAIATAAIGAGAVVGANSSNRYRARNASTTASTTALGGVIAARAFSRGAEARADRLGIDYMVKAGYNPLAAISMMNKIMNRRWSGLSDHPSGNKRMIMAYQYIAKNYPKYLVAGYDSVSYKRAIQYINTKLKTNNKGNNI